MHLRIASENDNEQLCQFFESFTSKGMVEFRYSRNHDFFAPYRTLGDSHRTYVLEDKSEILAMASFVVRDGLYQGEAVRTAFALDLRVAPHRKAVLEWSNHFLPVRTQIEQDFGTKYMFSVINLGEQAAMNTFIRPRNIRRPLPRYFLYRKFNVVTLHGQFPWAPDPIKHVRIREVSSANIDALVAYIHRRSAFRPFTPIWDSQSLEKTMGRLHDFRMSDFLVAFDSQDNVVGCVSPWLINKFQSLIPLSYNLRAHNFRQFLKFAKIFGWARTLTKPLSSTGQENAMSILTLGHFYANNEDIFESLLHYSYVRYPKADFMMYANNILDYKFFPPKSWISTAQPYALYSVMAPGESLPDFLHPSESLNPEIDILLAP